MDHDGRMAIATRIARSLLHTHGDDIIAVAVWGSVAHHADNEHSDLELWVATTDKVVPRETCQVYQGMSVQVSVTTATRALAEAGSVHQFWPINAAKWQEYRGLFERDDFFARLRRATADLRDDQFRAAIRERMVRLHEVGGKVRSSHARGDHYGLLKAGRDLTHNTAIIIGLANRAYYPSTRVLYPYSMQLPLLPDRYPDLVDLAGGFATADPALVQAAATVLWENLQSFVRRMGIEWETRDLIV